MLAREEKEVEKDELFDFLTGELVKRNSLGKVDCSIKNPVHVPCYRINCIIECARHPRRMAQSDG
jgi:hypothetical protein